MEVEGGKVPPPRYGHSMVVWNNKVPIQLQSITSFAALLLAAEPFVQCCNTTCWPYFSYSFEALYLLCVFESSLFPAVAGVWRAEQ